MIHSPCSIHLATASAVAGPIAILQVHGPGTVDLLQQLTGVAEWPVGRLRLVKFGDIDEGLAGLLRDGDNPWAQIMPHGGVRVVELLLERCIALGASYNNAPAVCEVYPEATSAIEADALATVARAASSAAIDLLLTQPALWRQIVAAERWFETLDTIAARSRVLDRLVDPPCVVVTGPPNVGKSTLTNRMLGRAASVVADLPGTTRDWVAGLAELAGVAVRWLDTPGLRHSDDAVEQQAITLARDVIASADVLIAMRDPTSAWLAAADLPRTPDVWVMNKIDDTERTARPHPNPLPKGEGIDPMRPLAISALNGRGVDQLQTLVLERLQLARVPMGTLWAFSTTLCAALGDGDLSALRAYVQPGGE